MPSASSSRAYSLLDVLRENQHRESGVPAPCLDGGAQSLVGEGGREPHIHQCDIRPVLNQCVEEFRAVVHCGGDFETMGRQKPDEPLSQKEEVFGENNAHGISIVVMVGPP